MCKKERQTLTSCFQHFWFAHGCTERAMVKLADLRPAKTVTYLSFQPYGAYKIIKNYQEIKGAPYVWIRFIFF